MNCSNCLHGYIYNDPCDSQYYVQCMITDEVHTPSHTCDNHTPNTEEESK